MNDKLDAYTAAIKEAQMMRKTALGEVRRGPEKIEERRPVLKFMIKLSLQANLMMAFFLWVLVGILKYFDRVDTAFVPALIWFFVFGIIYTGFAYLLFFYARHVENKAVAEALRPDRSYKWHARYDTEGMSEEDLKKLADAKDIKKPPAPPVGVGAKYYLHAGFLALCSLACCALGIMLFWSHVVS